MTATTDRERELVGQQSGGQPLLVLYTTDLEPVIDQLREHGVHVWNEREDADSRSLHFADLYGNVLVVAQLHGAAWRRDNYQIDQWEQRRSDPF